MGSSSENIAAQQAEQVKLYEEWREHPFTRKFFSRLNERIAHLHAELGREREEIEFRWLQGGVREQLFMAEAPQDILTELIRDLDSREDEDDS